ncbi:MAG TPA: NADH-quinone oxidoreductase subunit A [Thermoanaerobaculia bacterium]|nr:NADH-quinone oxidoreductase subunit A [Thermoanaerobaculia bacterium]
MPADYFPILLAIGVAIVVGLSLLGLSYLLGRQTGGRVKTTIYESGMPLLDRAHKRISIAFFLIAIDFIVFDVEAAFLYPWALVIRAGGWPLFWAVMVFVGLILVGYVYIWRKGGLDLGARPERVKAALLGGREGGR